jgi:hypothetical protein
MSVWRPESFSDFHRRLKDDPEGASNAMDLSFQTISKLTQENLDGVAALQPTGGITKKRPTNAALYSVFFDTTLGFPIWYQGRGIWKDAQGNIV